MPPQTTIDTKTLFKTIEASCFVIGPTVTAYFVANFTVDSYGYYYRDMEGGIATGVFLTALGFALRYWRRAD
ncbi:MAG: hypothetical protein IIA10_02215 [Proteobacteria bacterium]|nr:hypothetical protein [Pseudomonadota bacterium]MCH7835004.1 hypothetical protein [Pseudomonadota bacterium]